MDVRCRSPYGVRADALEILHRLSITDPDDALWDAYNWSDKMDVDHTMTHNYDFGMSIRKPLTPSSIHASFASLTEEEEAEACDPCLYDPSLFSPVSSHPTSPLQSTFSHYSGRDKVSTCTSSLFHPSFTRRLSFGVYACTFRGLLGHSLRSSAHRGRVPCRCLCATGSAMEP